MLVGTSWNLATYRGRGTIVAASKEAAASLVFGEHRKLSGSTGCNSFSGTYTTAGSDLTIVLGPMTHKACMSSALTAQEAAITAQLPMVKAYRITGSVLILIGNANAQLFTYTAAPTSLSGTSWKVTGVNNGKGAVEATALTEKLTASFGKDKSFSGFGGCNKLTGPYTLSGTTGVKIGPLVATKKACGTAVDQLESQYVTALSHATKYELAATTLTLRDGSNATQVTAERP
jgi:heat shock protein HslJ